MFRLLRATVAAVLLTLVFTVAARADLPEIRRAGVLRHLGIPYANFVTGRGDGMDVELIRAFALSLGVRYEYVKADWDTVVPDLIGRKVAVTGGTAVLGDPSPRRGDLIANGFTMLAWRKEVLDFSSPTFPSQIWLMARADSKVKPIRPTGDITRDILLTREVMAGRRVLALPGTCLDPALYRLSETGAEVVCFAGKLNELTPALLKGDAELTILDVPDALVSLQKWGGKVKVIGPVSDRQMMGVAFPKDSPRLRAAFDAFLRQSWKDGTYRNLVKKYYPTVSVYFPEFFRDK